MGKYVINDLNLDAYETTMFTGIGDMHIKLIEQYYNIEINVRGGEVNIDKCNDEIFNEVSKDVVIKDLINWCDERVVK